MATFADRSEHIIRQIQVLLRHGLIPADFSCCAIACANVLPDLQSTFPDARCVHAEADPAFWGRDVPRPFDVVVRPNPLRQSPNRGAPDAELPRLAETWFITNAHYTFVRATSWQIWRLVQGGFVVSRLGSAGNDSALVCFTPCTLPRSWWQRITSYARYVRACIRETYRQGGAGLVIATSARALWRRLVRLYYRMTPAPTFTFRGERYTCFRHGYNATWSNERSVEVPLGRAFVQQFAGQRILEVGNVLTHYGPVSHDVLDKYERAPGVINADVIDFRPAQKYDLIVSISTLEHVGWDEEEPQIPERAVAAFDNLRRHCLAPGGTLMATVPLNFNPHMDRFLEEGRIVFDEIAHLQRGKDGRWRQVDTIEASRGLRETPAIVVGIVRGGASVARAR